MKEEFLIIVIASLVVLGFSSLIYNYGNPNYSLTGFAIGDDLLNESLGEDPDGTINETNITIGTLTEQDVLIAFNETKKIIEEMKENDFSVYSFCRPCKICSGFSNFILLFLNFNLSF